MKRQAMETDQLPSSTPRKVRFAPKGPPRRKNLTPKSEDVNGEDGGDDEADEALLRKVKDHLARRRPEAEKKSSVQVVFAHGVASSTCLRTNGTAKDGSGNTRDDKGSRDSAANTGKDIFPLPPDTRTDCGVGSLQNASDPLFKQKKGVYQEPWDYNNSYYPITLPIRRPYSGDPEVLDREEFREARAGLEYDENALHAASDLDLMEKDDGVKMLFFQLPADLTFGPRRASASCREASGIFKPPEHASPGLNDLEMAGSSKAVGTVASAEAKGKGKGKEIRGSSLMVSSSAKGNETVNKSMSSSVAKLSEKVRSLEKLSGGYMGKMLVYKSGAVKLKLGDVVYDVSPGTDCTFSQDVAAINTTDRDCCVMGELGKRAVVTPDIDALLDPSISLTQ